MSDKIIGYAYYYTGDEVPDQNDGATLCIDCADDFVQPEDMERAAISDDSVYGNEVPYPECRDCGEVMRPWVDVRKKPVVVEAKGPFFDPSHVETLVGDFEVDGEYIEEHGGYYIIRGVEGELYPCGADIFEETYEEVDG